ncbi:MAG: xanthan lyase [Prevotellaceae bacterium]|jgi:hypothetical protein|nr:xanthan lyase [Prevotellaceae bacterium]
MRNFHFIFILLATCSLPSQVAMSQEVSPETRDQIGKYLTEFARREIRVAPITIDSISVNGGKTLQLFANEYASYIPFREAGVATIYEAIRHMLPSQLQSYDLQLITDGQPIEMLIPQALRSKRDKKLTFAPGNNKEALVTRLSVPYEPKAGLLHKHIALWQSHGFYFEPKLQRWEWQRARIFQTVEDLYTQSYVLPYLIPMLENAGANVLIPRERDIQTHEVIVDNDGGFDASLYVEQDGDRLWQTGTDAGFAYKQQVYQQMHNPFCDGTFRAVETIKKGNESTAEWLPEIPETGRYAVYVSYHTLPNSAPDAIYTVHHQGGATQFAVNQRMGGGTWIYLGTFLFDEGKSNENKVTLSNKTRKAGQVVTADAIKIGGGYGNIARGMEGVPEQISGYPRFTEGSRYWLQWAGFPDSIYSQSGGVNDYTDDYRSRGVWVNYLAGGSSVDPRATGLGIPIDMSLAFHSDAGTTPNDSIIGTLGIFMTRTEGGVYANGASRYLARDLTDLVQSQIVNDIRALYEPEWSRRGMWNSSYFEARVPRVPAMLLELLSHQNFADMRYGLDPRFRFTVARSIYKGVLQFISSQYKQDYVVQPLPVDHFALRFVDNKVELTWQPVEDPLEPTAKADRYIVYTRVGEGDFDNGVVVKGTSYATTIGRGQIYSFKVAALNDGGESFPSEILSTARAFNEKGTVMVVNGFDRISAPADFVSDGIAGFLDVKDHGVPDKTDISYIGSMKEFRRSVPWMDDDASGFGDSWGNYETMVIAGNTFDYPSVHGKAILASGYSFVSASDEAVESGHATLDDYPVVDFILGKERQTKIGRGGVVPLQFKTFTDAMQERLTSYCKRGGNVFVSGAYVGSDLWDNEGANQRDKDFATQILKYKWRVDQAAVGGKVKSVTTPHDVFTGIIDYYNTLNDTSYVVESPDAIEPADTLGHTFLRYAENNLSAGIVAKGETHNTCILGFPFESIRSDEAKKQLMQSILAFFAEQSAPKN